MRAFAAISSCSDWRMSGRRSSSAEGSPAGTCRRMRLIDKFLAARRDGPGIISKQDAQQIFLLPDAPFQVGNVRRRGVDELLGLPNVENRIDAVFHERLGQLQRFFARGQSALGNVEFEIEFAKLKISGGHVGDQRGVHFLARPIAGQQIARAPLRSPGDTFPRNPGPRRRIGSRGQCVYPYDGKGPTAGLC